MTQYTLKLSFDLRQVTQSLVYEFVLPNDVAHPLERTGPLAGTFNFKKGDEIFVEVIATSAASPNPPHTKNKDVLKDFAVTDCTFVSIPARMTEHLSLFDQASSCTSIDGPKAWGPVTVQNEPNNTVQLSRRSINPISVETKNGQWKISGYLSVELTPDNTQPYAQLYFFDPEGSSGNGGGFG